MARLRRGTAGRSTSVGNGVARNRATPASIFKLCKSMSHDQRELVKGVGFGGLLEIGSGRLPATISKWLVNNFDPESEEIVIPGRGSIKANAAAVQRITGLPMGKDQVKYEFNGSAINFIIGVCKFDDGSAPRVISLRETLKGNKEANDDYLRFWLMIAISTFLCGSTSLTISPKCYPALVDLSKVKDMNWCQFLVDTFKRSVGKMDRQDSVLGCQYFLTILYLDSLEIKNIQVPDKQPRVVAWNMQLINKVIKLDTNTNGTFGKLKLKEIDGLTTQTSLLGDLRDIDNFISHRASASMSLEKKRKISQVVRKACVGFTEVMGTLVSDLSVIIDDSVDQEDPRVRRTNNSDQEAAFRDGSHHQEEPQFRRTTRRRTDNSDRRPFIVDDDDEDDADYNVDEEDEEAEFVDYESEDLEDEGVELEDDDVVYEEVDPPDKFAKSFGVAETSLNRDQSRQAPAKDVRPPVAAFVEDKEDVGNIEDTTRQNTLNGDKDPIAPEVIPSKSSERLRGNMLIGEEPVPLEVVPSQKTRREKLPPSTSDAGKSTWDFSGPPMDLMRFIDSPTPHVSARKPMDEDDLFWDNLSEEQLKFLDDEADKVGAKGFQPNFVLVDEVDEMRVQKLTSSNPVKKPALNDGADETGAQNLPSSSAANKASIDDGTTKEASRSAAKEISIVTAKKVSSIALKEAIVPLDTPIEDLQMNGSNPKSAPSTSHTPAYQPVPRRPVRPGCALRSPYIDYDKKDKLKVTKIAELVYEVVCAATRRSTRSSSQSQSQSDEIIISYPDYYASLKHLSESVKPGGKLVNTIGEIAIYALNDRKTKFPVKRILPLRIAVMFPVLQNIPFKRLDRRVGHYFLLVLNLREQRFEVLDSMRSLSGPNLDNCSNKLINAIKKVWHFHYPNSKKPIDNYQLIDIQVPLQTNNHDCGFHMLTHCEHWNGNNMQEFNEKDIPIIRKILTYKCLSHPENNIAWKCMLKIC